MDPNNPLNPQPQTNSVPATADPAAAPLQPSQMPPMVDPSPMPAASTPTPTWPLPQVQAEPIAAPTTPSWNIPTPPTPMPQPTPSVPDISQFQPVTPPAATTAEPTLPAYMPSTPVPDNTFTPVPPPVDSPTAMAPSTVGGPPPWASPAMDNAPTDLSQLIGNSPAPTMESTPSDMPATVSAADVVAQTASPVPQVVTNEGGKGFPKWMIAAGLGIVLLVAGASAYFILGVGKSQDTTTSIPAEQQPLTTPPRTTNPSPQPTVESSSSATFGELQGSSPSAQATPSGQTAAEILKQRAAQGR